MALLSPLISRVRALPPRRRTAWLIGAALLAAVFGPGTLQWLQISWQHHTVSGRIRALEAQQQALQAERERLTHDTTYLEGLVRSTFKVAKPGELVVPMDDASSKSH
ncbi:MAG: septum formation initiator family protein [Candidatus Omnitrophica bacterium]|nr:septum formation initiator family protein [Candidatus Omnitrophota bacterium]